MMSPERYKTQLIAIAISVLVRSLMSGSRRSKGRVNVVAGTPKTNNMKAVSMDTNNGMLGRQR